VSHGGVLAPVGIPDRTYGSTYHDKGTIELSEAISDALFSRIGRRPHLVLNLLHRTKLDPNRPVEEAAQGNAEAIRAWEEFHASIAKACDAIIASWGRGLYVDVHSHHQPIDRIELGYLLSAEVLNTASASDIDSERFSARHSLGCLIEDRAHRLSDALWGPFSFGSLLEKGGYYAVPSSEHPRPGGQMTYYNGGYNTFRHGASATKRICGIQAEHYRKGILDAESDRRRYAGVFAEAVITWLNHFLKIDLKSQRDGPANGAMPAAPRSR